MDARRLNLEGCAWRDNGEPVPNGTDGPTLLKAVAGLCGTRAGRGAILGVPCSGLAEAAANAASTAFWECELEAMRRRDAEAETGVDLEDPCPGFWLEMLAERSPDALERPTRLKLDVVECGWTFSQDPAMSAPPDAEGETAALRCGELKPFTDDASFCWAGGGDASFRLSLPSSKSTSFL